MLKKYIVTIMCDETMIEMILKSKMTKQQMYDVLCKMYDDFDSCVINECILNFDFAYIVSNNETHGNLKCCYVVNNKCCK